MSSSSHARIPSRSDRRTATDSGSTQPRAPSGQQGGSRSERSDPRRQPSPQPSTSTGGHKRTASGVQRSSKAVEERRTERVQVTTRETISSRTRSPERRPGSTQPPERQRPEASRTHSGDPRPKPAKMEAPTGIFSIVYIGLW